LNSYNTDEIDKSIPDVVFNSNRTNTKWFNPNNVDPRTPDYFNSVKSTWEENVTREDIGAGKL